MSVNFYSMLFRDSNHSKERDEMYFYPNKVNHVQTNQSFTPQKLVKSVFVDAHEQVGMH